MMSQPFLFKLIISCGLLIGSLILIRAEVPQSPSSPTGKASDPQLSQGPDRPISGIPTATTLPQLARETLEHYFATGDLLSPPEPLPQSWRRSTGVFVTLSQQGQTRGCWGTLISASPDLAQATIRAAVGAATRDPRYPPLRATELPQISIQVALVEQVAPIQSITEVDPTQAGVFVRAGSQGGVLLPGEALTSDWQIATARRWAGIPPGVPVEIFRVEAQLLHEF